MIQSSRWIFSAALIALTGCSSGFGPRKVSNPDPAAKIPAIEASVAAKDYSSVAQLVKDLNSDDPAVRFYSINGLQRLTHENFGYHYYDDEDQRAPAIEKWKLWLQGWQAGRHDARK